MEAKVTVDYCSKCRDGEAREKAKVKSEEELRTKRASPVRVGFLSMYFREHSSTKVAEGVISALARDPRFDVYLLAPPQPEYQRWERLKQVVGEGNTVAVPSSSLELARKEIAKLKLDALVFVEIGSHPLPLLLGYSRLAPLQVAFWGYLTTTVAPEVDYFVTSHLFESGRDW